MAIGYHQSKSWFIKVWKSIQFFYVPTCPVFAGPVTFFWLCRVTEGKIMVKCQGLYSHSKSFWLWEIIKGKYVTGFGKINHFVTFDTSNIYGQNNALHSTSQPYSEYRVSKCVHWITRKPLKYFNRSICTVMVT